ncbi:MAG: hypothetical protein H0W78_00165 [Planctomycetes bacterium]|jgi:hypothetical protein|nr:hypothetical protein [Planctomycetota bacterium]
MNDDHLSHLVRALDAAVESSPAGIAERTALCGSLDHAALRLRCLTARLGTVADESPYLAFLRRTTRAHQSTHAVAISA